jgi:hypothetical protein
MKQEELRVFYCVSRAGATGDRTRRGCSSILWIPKLDPSNILIQNLIERYLLNRNLTQNI